ncbi:MAG: CDP-glycerol glycerophosphotransferase family protein, partial [Micrococcales bacterium]
MNQIKRLLKTYSPTRVLGALRRRRSDWMRKLQYRPQATKTLREAVLFESFQGKVIGDNPLDIFNEVKSRFPNLELIWTTGKGTQAPVGARGVRFGSRDWLQALATSKYLVNNTNFPWYFRKVPGQIYLQTWHGTPLKRLGRDIPNNYLTKSYLDTMDREATFWNYLISPSPFCTEIFPGSFGYSGNIIETGYPRNDRLSKITGAQRQEIRERIGVSNPSTFIVMYAPTWRDYNRSATGNWQSVNFMDENIELPEGFQMIYRGHTNTHAVHSKAVAGRAINVTLYPDVTELYIAADVLITDFSSVMFDYTVTGKPIMFLAPDLERYRSERGFYFDFEALAPGPILNSDTEVLQALGRIDQVSKLYEPRYRAWQEKFNSLEDGN